MRQVSTVCPQTRHLEANARKRPIGPFSKSTERDKAVSAGPRPISGNNNVHTDQPGSVTYCLLLRLTSLLKCMCFACIPIVAPADIAARMYRSIRLDCIFLDSLLTRWKFVAPPPGLIGVHVPCYIYMYISLPPPFWGVIVSS